MIFSTTNNKQNIDLCNILTNMGGSHALSGKVMGVCKLMWLKQFILCQERETSPHKNIFDDKIV